MTIPAYIPLINPLPGPDSQYLFTDRDIVLPANNKTHIFRIADVVLPLQPICEIRFGRNWVLTEVAGSASNPKLSGTQVKENMGLSDAIITFSGFLMSTGSTMTQMLRLQSGRESENIHWADKLKRIKILFNEETSLPIYDWAPAEEPFINLPFDDVYQQWKDNPKDLRVKDLGVSMFEELGITDAVLLSFDLFERAGVERKGYTLRLQQDRVVLLDEIMPTEGS